MYEPPTEPIFFLRLPEVLKRTGMSKSKLYNKVRVEEFPKPVRDGNTSSWPEHEVTAWQQAKMAARSA